MFEWVGVCMYVGVYVCVCMYVVCMLYVQVMDSFCNLASLVDSHSYHTRHRLFQQHARSPTCFVAIGAAVSV